MTILLDIFLILLFVAIAGLQVWVLFKIKELQATYDQFISSQNNFVHFIEKARQSLTLLTDQSKQVLPELKKNIETSESLMQDFSFVLARANKKIDLLEELNNHSSHVPLAQDPVRTDTTTNVEINNDPLMARLERMELLENSNDDRGNFLNSVVSSKQEDLIDKALKEIL